MQLMVKMIKLNLLIVALIFISKSTSKISNSNNEKKLLFRNRINPESESSPSSKFSFGSEPESENGGHTQRGCFTQHYQLVVPHDIHPGFAIVKLSNGNRDASVATHHGISNYQLSANEFSDFFYLLDDGLLMSIANVSSLVNLPVNLTVVEEFDDVRQMSSSSNRSCEHYLNIRVVIADGGSLPNSRYSNGRFRFTTASNCGKTATVAENLPVGQAVDEFLKIGIERVDRDVTNSKVPFHKITYKIVDDVAATTHRQNFRLVYDHAIVDLPSVRDVHKSHIAAFSKIALVTARTLDFEMETNFSLIVRAMEPDSNRTIDCQVHIQIENLNDNRLEFEHPVYEFTLGNRSKFERLKTVVGTVKAFDRDGDPVTYHIKQNNFFIIVPKTGDILLIEDVDVSGTYEDLRLSFLVSARDSRKPHWKSLRNAQVLVTFKAAALPKPVVRMSSMLGANNTHNVGSNLVRGKRRVTRAVRPTKRLELADPRP